MSHFPKPAFPFRSVAELGSPEGPFKTDISGWHSDHDYFRELIAELQPKTIIEVGTWKGASALNMAQLTDDTQAKIYCVDTWLGGYEMMIHEDKPAHNLFRVNGYPHIYYQFLHNVYHTPYANRIYPIPQTSINGSRALKSLGVTADLIYIDGSHLLEDVYEDLKAYWPLLRSGGIMFGDDVSMSGVEVSAKRFAMEMDLPMTVADNIFWTLRKP